MTKWTIYDKIEKVEKKYTFLSQKMTKLSIFDKIEEAKKYTGLSENDKIKQFWQNWRSEKIHGPLTKWQNWAFLTKLKKRKNTRVSQKMTKLSNFDKIEEAKKSTVLSENDKIEHFWQNWRSEKKWQNWSILTKLKKRKIHEPLTKWQNGAFLTKIVCYITTHSVYS